MRVEFGGWCIWEEDLLAHTLEARKYEHKGEQCEGNTSSAIDRSNVLWSGTACH